MACPALLPRTVQTAWGRLLRTSAVLLLSLIGGLLGGLLGGCAPFSLNLKFSVEADANANSPVMISVVVIYKKDALEKLQTLNAKQFFKQREQVLRDFPKDVEEQMWEYIPGQQVPPFRRGVRWNVVGGLIFANYRSPGDHRYVFDPRNETKITCGSKDLVLQVTPSTLDKIRGLAKQVPTEMPALDPGAIQ